MRTQLPKKSVKKAARIWKGYVGIVDSSKDPNAGTYRSSASKYGQEYSDLLWDEYQRDQAEAKLRYERERKQQHDADRHRAVGRINQCC